MGTFAVRVNASRAAASPRHNGKRVGRALAMICVCWGPTLGGYPAEEFDMAFDATGIGPLRADVRLEATSTVHALLVAFRWQDAQPDRIHSHLAKLAGGPPGQLQMGHG